MYATCLCIVVAMYVYVDDRFGPKVKKVLPLRLEVLALQSSFPWVKLNGEDESWILTLFTRLLGLTVEYGIQDLSMGKVIRTPDQGSQSTGWGPK